MIEKKEVILSPRMEKVVRDHKRKTADKECKDNAKLRSAGVGVKVSKGTGKLRALNDLVTCPEEVGAIVLREFLDEGSKEEPKHYAISASGLQLPSDFSPVTKRNYESIQETINEVSAKLKDHYICAMPVAKLLLLFDILESAKIGKAPRLVETLVELLFTKLHFNNLTNADLTYQGFSVTWCKNLRRYYKEHCVDKGNFSNKKPKMSFVSKVLKAYYMSLYSQRGLAGAIPLEVNQGVLELMYQVWPGFNDLLVGLAPIDKMQNVYFKVLTKKQMIIPYVVINCGALFRALMEGWGKESSAWDDFIATNGKRTHIFREYGIQILNLMLLTGADINYLRDRVLYFWLEEEILRNKM